jgi:hypothetical protein
MGSERRRAIERSVDESETFFWISSGLSVMKMAEAGVLALILVLGPCRAGKNLEWITAGLRKPMRGATSLVMRKNGSCSAERERERDRCQFRRARARHRSLTDHT